MSEIGINRSSDWNYLYSVQLNKILANREFCSIIQRIPVIPARFVHISPDAWPIRHKLFLSMPVVPKRFALQIVFLYRLSSNYIV